MRKAVLLSVGLSAFFGLVPAACNRPPPQPPPPPTPFKTTADMKELMLSVVTPAANGFWGVLGEVATEPGKGYVDLFPTTEEEWARVHQSAMALAEVGNLLMLPGRAKDNGEWMKQATGLIAMGQDILKAVDARDRAKMEDLAPKLDEFCDECHIKYDPAYTQVPAK